MKAAVAALRPWARALRQQGLVVYCIGRDARTPWFAKVLAGLVAAYALSPIDLIPDFIPVLGLLDDLVIVPLGVLLVMRLVPEEVLRDARSRAAERIDVPLARGLVVAIVGIWCIVIAASAGWAWRTWGR